MPRCPFRCSSRSIRASLEFEPQRALVTGNRHLRGRRPESRRDRCQHDQPPVHHRLPPWETTWGLHRGCQMIGAAEMPECWRKRLDGEHGMLIGAHLSCVTAHRCALMHRRTAEEVGPRRPPRPGSLAPGRPTASRGEPLPTPAISPAANRLPLEPKAATRGLDAVFEGVFDDRQRCPLHPPLAR